MTDQFRPFTLSILDVDHARNSYNCMIREQKLNNSSQIMTNIDGVDIT